MLFYLTFGLARRSLLPLQLRVRIPRRRIYPILTSGTLGIEALVGSIL